MMESLEAEEQQPPQPVETPAQIGQRLADAVVAEQQQHAGPERAHLAVGKRTALILGGRPWPPARAPST